MQLFIRNGKGSKDRYALLSNIDQINSWLKQMHAFAMAKYMGCDWKTDSKSKIRFCLFNIFVNNVRNPPTG